MKITGGRIEEFLRSPPDHVRAVLVYGRDEGLVRERAARILGRIVDDPADPFRVAELSGRDIETDPARLADEAAALSMIGGRRVVRVRESAETAHKVFASFLEHPVGDNLVIVEAGDLGPRAALRALFDSAERAAAIACYPDEGAGLDRVIAESLAAHGLAGDAEVRGYLAAHLGSDRMVTRSEIAKLAVYMGESTTVRLEDARACVGDSGAASVDELLSALGTGNQDALDRALDRVFEDGTAPVGLLRLVNRHFQRLHLAAGHIGQGLPPDKAIGRLKPPVIFKAMASFRTQLGIWTPDRLTDALDLLLAAEADCKTSGMPDQTLCRRALTRLAQMARRH